MQNMKTITFEKPFSYSVGGIYQQASEVTVVEPPYKRRDVHYTMRGYMGETEIALAKAFAGLSTPEAKPANDDEAHIAKKEKPDPDGSGLMEQMRLALGEKRFPTFIQYVHDKLTGDRVLCFIGKDDTPEDERLAVSPMHWEQIADAGGLQAVDNVLMAFVSFFEDRGSTPPTQKTAKPTNGDELSLPSPASPPARSRSRQPNG